MRFIANSSHLCQYECPDTLRPYPAGFLAILNRSKFRGFRFLISVQASINSALL